VAKRLLRDCLQRIDALEKANASFGNSMDVFMDQLPQMVERALESGAQRELEPSNVKELHIKNPETNND
jgi:hypothetical protein